MALRARAFIVARHVLLVSLALGVLTLPVIGPAVVDRLRPARDASLVSEPTSRSVVRRDIESSFTLEGRVEPLATVPVSSPVSGTIREIRADSGVSVDPSQVLLVVAPAPGTAPSAPVPVRPTATGTFLRSSLQVGQEVRRLEHLGSVESQAHAVGAEIDPRHLYRFSVPVAIGADVEGVIGKASCEFRSVDRQVPAGSSPPSDDVTYVLRCALPVDLVTIVGSRATLDVVTARSEDALVVPRTALEGTPGNVYVRRLSADGGQDRVPVKVGVLSDTDAEVIEGLQEGERVLDPADQG